MKETIVTNGIKILDRHILHLDGNRRKIGAERLVGVLCGIMNTKRIHKE